LWLLAYFLIISSLLEDVANNDLIKRVFPLNDVLDDILTGGLTLENIFLDNRSSQNT